MTWPPGGHAGMYFCRSSGWAALSYTSSQLGWDARFQRFQDGRDRPVAAAVRRRLPELEPLPQPDKRFPDPVMVLSADPPDDLVLVDVAMDEFRCYLGFADSAHARDDLDGRGCRLPAMRLACSVSSSAARPVKLAITGGISFDQIRWGTADPVLLASRCQRAALRCLDAVFGLPGRLPELQEHRAIPVQRLDYLFQDTPARHAGVTEDVVDCRGTDPAAPGPSRDLSH